MLKVYRMPNGHKYKFEENLAPAGAVLIEKKTKEPETKTKKTANKAKKTSNKSKKVETK